MGDVSKAVDLPKPFKIDDLPQDIQDFLTKHGGIGLLTEKCMELNPQWVDPPMAWAFIIQWARDELKLLQKSEELAELKKSSSILKDDIQA